MFVVFEGIDGAGKGRQRNQILAALEHIVTDLSTTEFPDHQSQIYQHLIHPALHEEIKLSAEAWFLSFALDQILWQDKIKAARGSKDKFFLADGYFTTTLVYQCLLEKQIELNTALKFAKNFGIAEPDFVIYIDVDPEIAMQRKQIEEGHDEGLDIYERSLDKQRTLRSGFKKMVAENIFGKWIEVDGSKSIAEVTEDIKEVLTTHKIITF